MHDRYTEEGSLLGPDQQPRGMTDQSGAGIHPCCLQWGKWDDCRTQGAQTGTSRMKSVVARLQELKLLRAEDGVGRGVVDDLEEDTGTAFSGSVYQFNEV